MEEVRKGFSLIGNGIQKSVANVLPEVPVLTTVLPTLPTVVGKGWTAYDVFVLIAVVYVYIRMFQRVWKFFRGINISEGIEKASDCLPLTRRNRSAYEQVFESVKRGSDFFTGDWPSCQLAIWTKDDVGKWQVNGCAWRYQNYIITATHVLEDNVQIGVSTADSKMQIIEVVVLHDENDLAILRVPESIFSLVPVKTARVDSPDAGFVRCVGPTKTSNTSSGICKSTDVFGVVEYTGSTLHGYSGAPYVSGNNTVVGMHSNGGQKNIGLNAEYIACIIDCLPEKRRFGSKKRQQSDWYNELVTSTSVIRARRSKGNPDEYFVQVNGHYYVMDGADYKEFTHKAKHAGARVDLDNKSDMATYESKNFLGKTCTCAKKAQCSEQVQQTEKKVQCDEMEKEKSQQTQTEPIPSSSTSVPIKPIPTIEDLCAEIKLLRDIVHCSRPSETSMITECQSSHHNKKQKKQKKKHSKPTQVEEQNSGPGPSQ